jgi:hypothetical protein
LTLNSGVVQRFFPLDDLATLIWSRIAKSGDTMTKGKAFAVVGHKHWGKSTTLKALSDGSTYVRRLSITNHDFFIRRMSNDDRPGPFFKLLNDLDPSIWPHVIAAFCPTFSDKKQRAVLISSLQSLRRRYQLFFFVLRTDYHRQKRHITDDEIEMLGRFGTVKVFADTKASPEKRARALKRFIAKFV